MLRMRSSFVHWNEMRLYNVALFLFLCSVCIGLFFSFEFAVTFFALFFFLFSFLTVVVDEMLLRCCFSSTSAIIEFKIQLQLKNYYTSRTTAANSVIIFRAIVLKKTMHVKPPLLFSCLWPSSDNSSSPLTSSWRCINPWKWHHFSYLFLEEDEAIRKEMESFRDVLIQLQEFNEKVSSTCTLGTQLKVPLTVVIHRVIIVLFWNYFLTLGVCLVQKEFSGLKWTMAWTVKVQMHLFPIFFN